MINMYKMCHSRHHAHEKRLVHYYGGKTLIMVHVDTEYIHCFNTRIGKHANFKHKIEQDRENFRKRLAQLEEDKNDLLDQKLAAEEEAIVLGKKLRKLEEEMARKIEETRRKIDGEIDRKAEIEAEAERLQVLLLVLLIRSIHI